MANVRAITTFHTSNLTVAEGEQRDSTDPVVARFPQFFAPEGATRPVERATAAPGERRTTRPTKKAAPKPQADDVADSNDEA